MKKVLLLIGLFCLLFADCNGVFADTSALVFDDASSVTLARIVRAKQQMEQQIQLKSVQVEEELKGVIVDEEDLSPELKQWLVKDTDLEGTWSGGMYHGETMEIKRTDDGGFDVTFVAWGEFSLWRLKRKAVFKEGLLQFQSPVQSYMGDIYTNYYLLEIDGTFVFFRDKWANRLIERQKVSKNWDKVNAQEKEGLLGLMGLVRKGDEQEY